MLKDILSTKGEVKFTLIGPDGNVKSSVGKNLVVNTGLAYITSRMKDATSSVMTHMALGTDSAATAGNNSILGNEIVGSRVVLDSTTRVTTSVTNDSIEYIATFGQNVGTGAVTEAGLFNAITAGTMLARIVFPVINKGALDTLVITWKIQLL